MRRGIEDYFDYFVVRPYSTVELICAPFGSYKRKGHDWGVKSQKKIRREKRQRGAYHG